MRRCAFLLSIVLVVTAPDHLAVWIVAVPHLAAIEMTAVAAHDSAGKAAISAVLPFQFFPARELNLNQIKYVRIYDRRMAVLHIILRHLAFVHLHLLREEVRAVGLLQKRIADVLLVPQYSRFYTMCAVGAS